MPLAAPTPPENRDGFPPIGDYAIVGDTRTAALVSRDGAVEWLCLPHFSGPSMFAALLDRERGGHFSVRPTAPYSVTRSYRQGTNVLVTRFRTDDGAELHLTDVMPLYDDEYRDRLQPQRELLRRIEAFGGAIEVEISYMPRPDYGRSGVDLVRRGRLGWACQHREHLLNLLTDLPLEPSDGGLVGRVSLTPGACAYLSLTYAANDVAVLAPLGAEAEARIDSTAAWWTAWSNACAVTGPYRDAVMRSALTLKLLTYTLSGAIVAAPTTSLPEVVGGVRNWDYRYCWLRDAALTLRAFTDLGYGAEGRAFLGWLLHATRLTAPELQVMYDVYGEARLPEREIAHLAGYRGSRPVRVGNAAWRQLQLDVYGEVVLAAYDALQRGSELDHSERRMLAGIGDLICRQWKRPDQGLWEARTEPRQHTHSKVMCWVALDRLVKLHRQGHLRVPADRFKAEMDTIRDTIEWRGYSTRVKSYVGIFDSQAIDAALLLVPHYGYARADSERMRNTFARIDESLTREGLVYRYRYLNDALPGSEGAFGVCSFWAVDYLARAGRVTEAEERFERLLGRANDVGLYAEEFDPASGELLGNFPQAYTHVGLITAAVSIATARGEMAEKGE